MPGPKCEYTAKKILGMGEAGRQARPRAWDREAACLVSGGAPNMHQACGERPRCDKRSTVARVRAHAHVRAWPREKLGGGAELTLLPRAIS